MTRSKQHSQPQRRSPASHLARALLFFILLLSGSELPYSSATAAGMLRCGSFLIQEGDDASTVLAKCGQPTQRTTLTAPVYASSADGATFPTGQVAYTQVWRYDRGSTSFPVILKIVDGVVRSIHFVR